MRMKVDVVAVKAMKVADPASIIGLLLREGVRESVDDSAIGAAIALGRSRAHAAPLRATLAATRASRNSRGFEMIFTTPLEHNDD